MRPWNECVTLEDHHPIEDFECGEASMDGWCKNARKSHKSNLSTVWVCPDSHGAIAGFFTLSSHTVRASQWEGTAAKDDGGVAVSPATLLGKIAIRRDLRKQKLGSILLLQAAATAVRGSEFSSSRLLVLDAANDKLCIWYKGHNFKSFSESNPLAMYMKMSTAKKLVVAKSELIVP